VSDPPARIPQLDPSELTDEAREVFSALTGGGPPNEASTHNHVLRTFANYPALTKPFLTFNGHVLFDTTLPPRLRQIAIHRVAWIRGATYMWSSHLRVSLPIGMTRDDFEAAKVGADSPRWSELERYVVLAVDELLAASQVSDETWAVLSAHLDRQQLMDLLFTVGCYTLLGMVFNALRIEREPELVALAEEFGAP
jgi:alkylhydroperoxidase family enzyme